MWRMPCCAIRRWPNAAWSGGPTRRACSWSRRMWCSSPGSRARPRWRRACRISSSRTSPFTSIRVRLNSSTSCRAPKPVNCNGSNCAATAAPEENMQRPEIDNLGARPEDSAVPDLASRLTQDHHQSLKLWLRMLACTVRIENEIRSRLRTTFGITLPRFDLMAQLERHPQGLRMGELSKRMMVTGGNVTGITDQLEREKLVLRVTDPADR